MILGNTYYSGEREIQIMIYLMKKHGIKRVIASLGATNIIFVASLPILTLRCIPW